MSYAYILTPQALTIHVDGKSRTIHSSNARFGEIKEALKEKNFDLIFSIMDQEERIINFSDGKIEIKDGVIFYNNQAFDNVICDKILSMMSEGFDIDPMLKFLNNLLENPSKTSVEELYLFLEKSNLPITPDGHFLAYKKVTEDFKDFRTNKIDNSPGKTVKMLRNQVDDNRYNTCSSGLHFCSLGYLKAFNPKEGKIIIVKINPKDVVSVPNDYENTKGRCCEYTVIEEYKGDISSLAFDKSVVDPANDNWFPENESEETSSNELETDDLATNITELDEESEDALMENPPVMDGGDFKETEENNSEEKGKIPELTEDGSHKKPEHPDAQKDGIPSAVKELVGQRRIRDSFIYDVTAVAGPIRSPKGHFTGKWALYVKNINTNVEGVLDMGSILNDPIYSEKNKSSLTSDIMRLAHEYRKNNFNDSEE